MPRSSRLDLAPELLIRLLHRCGAFDHVDLILQHGEHATFHAAMRVDALPDSSDLDGQLVRLVINRCPESAGHPNCFPPSWPRVKVDRHSSEREDTDKSLAYWLP